MKPFFIGMLVVLFVSISACSPSQMPGSTFTPTRTNNRTDTLTPTLTQTYTPTLTFSPTPTPGPELLAYLPTTADLPQCQWVEYFVYLKSASLWCYMAGNLNLNADVEAQDKLLSQADLNISKPIATVTVPTIGQGSLAAQLVEGGKDILLEFYKGNASISIENYTTNGKANIDYVVAVAQKVDQLIPDQIVPPSLLSFPDQLNEAAFQKYFNSIDFTIKSEQGQKIDKFTQNSKVCVQDYPKKISRERYLVGLYNVQTQMIEEKSYYEMRGSMKCSGGPNYLLGGFKSGDRYELWIAVGDTLVAVYSFETK